MRLDARRPRSGTIGLMIRAQYHFRSTPEGLIAWDVRRLIELSRNLPVQEIELSAIAELDHDHWYAHGGEAPTCRSIAGHCALIQAADLAYPIILDASGRVMDGMHRAAKALIEGRPTLKAVRFTTDPAPDYLDCDPQTLPYED